MPAAGCIVAAMGVKGTPPLSAACYDGGEFLFLFRRLDGKKGAMSNRAINLPPMPQPADFNYQPQVDAEYNERAKKEYEKALAIWERVVEKIIGK